MITAQFICNAAAEQTVLPLDRVRACDCNFTLVKLAFAEGVDDGAYRSLPLAEQARLNRIGFARYRQWLRQNPDTVRDLNAAALQYLSAGDEES